MSNILEASCRVAFSGLIHDIGKFAERAKIEISPSEKNNNIHLYCPYNSEHNYHSHIHAAYTGVAIGIIEEYLPLINNADMFPFQTDDKDNSIINAAAMHHKPDTYLQKIISTADRLSSAFERTKFEEYNQVAESEDYQSARLIPLFEKLLQKKDAIFQYRYPLKALSPAAIFPAIKKDMGKDEATQEYAKLWKDFVQNIQKTNNRTDWNVWLDNFDTLYSIYTQNIPSASYKTLADVSLYDHSKSTAALVTALWRYHYETQTETLEELKDDSKKKFLLIQGDVSGIQSFIFEAGTQKNAYKILRGRSFMISLFSECAALKILDALDLPSTSQIMNAAGKFVIVAPNTKEVKNKLNDIRDDINNWFQQNYYGLVSVGIATIEATQKDFEDKNFTMLQRKIYQSLSVAKMQKFDLCRHQVTFNDFFEKYKEKKGLCCFDGRMPAQELVPYTQDEYSCPRCLDILSLGESLTYQNRIYISRQKFQNGLKTDILGFYMGWQSEGEILRAWDISLPTDESSALFNGCARRYINAYIPRFTPEEIDKEIYQNINGAKVGKPKTFEHLAIENCIFQDGKLKTKPALMSVKGDIDNLGYILQSGLKNTTFATMAGLSRQINNFFAIWLPWLCQTEDKAKNIYTIFAGGDDFYFIGPWLDMVQILPHIRRRFADYVCNNLQVTFSTGMCMTPSGDNVINMSSIVEDALEKAKGRKIERETVKNAVCCFQQVVSYDDFYNLLESEKQLEDLSQKYELSTRYIYSLLDLCDDASAADEDFTRAMWRSKLVYRTTRFVETNKKIESENKDLVVELILKQIGNAIQQYKTSYKIALSIWLYQHRER